MTCADPDDGDRVFGAADILTLVFIPHYTLQLPDDVTLLVPYVGSGRSRVYHSNRYMSKADIDALLNFSVSLGANYVGEWSDPQFSFEQLKITIVDPTNASQAAIEAFNFTVSCVPGAVVMADATSDDSPCSTADLQPAVFERSWGRGRPRIVNITSLTSAPDRLLAAGDRILVVFDADVDVAAAETGTASLSGTDAVSTLFTLPPSLTTGSLEGTWVDPRAFQIEIVSPPSDGAIFVGNDYSLSCAPDAPIALQLPPGVRARPRPPSAGTRPHSPALALTRPHSPALARARPHSPALARARPHSPALARTRSRRCRRTPGARQVKAARHHARPSTGRSKAIGSMLQGQRRVMCSSASWRFLRCAA